MLLTKTRRIVIADKKKEEEVEVAAVAAVQGKYYKEKYDAVFKNTRRRIDGRALADHRDVYMSCDITEDCRGSAYVEIGSTKVICGVIGPLEIPNIIGYREEGIVKCEVNYAAVRDWGIDEDDQYQGNKGSESTSGFRQDKLLALRLQKVLDAVVCRIIVTVLILESDGPCFPAVVSAASLALADARLPMFDLVASVSMGIHSDMILVDLTEIEEVFCAEVTPECSSVKDRAVVTLAYMPSLEQIVDYWQYGNTACSTVADMIPTGCDRCRLIVEMQRKTLVKTLKQNLESKTKPTKEITDPAQHTEQVESLKKAFGNIKTEDPVAKENVEGHASEEAS